MTFLIIKVEDILRVRGFIGKGVRLPSTELLEEAADLWVFTGELPSPHSDLRGANIDNKFLVTGKRCQIIILLSSKCSLNNDDSY